MTDAAARFTLQGTRVITPAGVRAVSLIIEGGRIASVNAYGDVLDGGSVKDVGDLVISPGVVDAHVHVNEPGRTEWEGFETATQAAAAGGVTTLVDMPLNSSPVTVDYSALRAKRDSAAGKCWVDVGFYGGLVPGSAEQVPGLIQEGVHGVKAFLCDSGMDEFPAATRADLRAALPHLAAAGVPLLVHAELVSVAEAVCADQCSYQEYLQSRPDRWECDAIALLIDLCREFHSPVHIVHLATCEALGMIRSAKQEGLPLTVETCPHYLYFSADEIAGDCNTLLKCAPPIRSSANRASLRRAVRAGLIDTIGSDHSPCPPDMKLLDACDYQAAWGGIASIQLTLSNTWTVLAAAGGTLPELSELLSAAPARLVGLHERKGRIEPGCDADLVVWDPESSWTVSRDRMLHRHRLTPYEGETLKGQVRQTYVRGQVAYDGGEVATDATGELLRRGRGAGRLA